jgi:[acyl-carrier-protein] S-malonyltransferase
MAEIQAERPGTMAAIIGLSADVLAKLCASASTSGLVTLANLNTPSQIVVSGEASGVEALMELARVNGAEKVVRLQVGAAFHSPLMQTVQTRLGKVMAEMTWKDPTIPLVANASGKILTSGGQVHEALIAQIASPVLWVDCVQTLRAAGCGAFLELGSGRVLTGLVRQIDPETETAAADSPAKITRFAQARAVSTEAG